MNIHEWAQRWHLPPMALKELADMSIYTPPNPKASDESEQATHNRVRLQASQRGLHVWRNNVGAGRIEGAGYLRWGLANDTHEINTLVKSADLIGIEPVLITPAHVGTRIGRFWSRECKPLGWKPAKEGKLAIREAAQVRWANIINGLGGDAKI